MMFGYACNQTRELMPAPIQMAKAISVRAVEAREKGILPYLRPDGKCQVTVEYDGRKPVRVHTVVVSLQHSPAMNDKQGQLRQDVIERIVKPVVPAQWLDRRTIHHVNPTGRFEVGGPHGDTGLTGRKIVVDTYGGYAPHGGGAFSGKDPSKVDRSAALMGRYVAKNVVAAGLADECQIQVAYAIGVAEPVSLLVDTRGTAKVSEEKLSQAIRELCSFKPKAIIERFQLRRPIYRLTAGLGPFGRELPEFLWEKTDLAAELKAAVK
jgi:S-adenosylmethionine synthetase